MRTVEILEPSVKSLFLTFRFNGKEISTGTGFLLQSPRGYFLITNRHNVTGKNNDTEELLSPTGAIPNEVVISHNFKDKLGTWIDHTEFLYKNETPKDMW